MILAQRFKSWTVLAAAFSIGAIAPGCEGCSHERKPYTPFTKDGGLTTEDSAEAPSATPVSSVAFSPTVGVAASGAHYPLEPGVIDAPSGKVFVSALPIDADKDGTTDLIAWLEGTNHRGGELWFFSGADRANPQPVAKLPANLGEGSCKRKVELAASGPTTVTALITADCEGGKKLSHFVAARLKTKAKPEVRLEGSLGAGEPGETLSFALATEDRDKDGVDDLSVTVKLEGLGEPFEPSGKVQVSLPFVDRPAGMARDSSEPLASFERLAGTAFIKAKGPKSADAAVLDAARTLRLATIVCDEFGTPLLTTNGGNIHCGDTGFVAEAIGAAANAAVAKHEWGAALDALDLLHSLKSDPRKRGNETDKALAKAIPIVRPRSLHTVAAPVKPDGVLSPLSFDADGNLLVESGDGVIQVNAQSFAEEPSQAAPWPLRFAWHDTGTEFVATGAKRVCSPRALVLSERIGDQDATETMPNLEPFLTSKLATCSEGSVPLSPLLQGAGSSTLGLLGEVYKVEARGSATTAVLVPTPETSAGPSLPGQSRSFDGSAVVLPIKGGALVITPKDASRWISDDLDGSSRCVVQNGAKRIACVTTKGAVLLEK